MKIARTRTTRKTGENSEKEREREISVNYRVMEFVSAMQPPRIGAKTWQSSIVPVHRLLISHFLRVRLQFHRLGKRVWREREREGERERVRGGKIGNRARACGSFNERESYRWKTSSSRSTTLPRDNYRCRFPVYCNLKREEWEPQIHT